MENHRRDRLNLAFIGCGFATRLHSKTLRKFRDRVRLYYASRDIRKAEMYNKKYAGAGAFGSYEEVLQHPDIDGVLIVTPPQQHLQWTLKSLQAGKHVIVEKPPFLQATDFDEVQRLSAEIGKQVLVAENYYYKPLAFRLRSLLETGVIGEILFVHINALKYQQTGDWRDDPRLAGGGALFEGGIHWINFIANLGFSFDHFQGLFPGKFTEVEKSILVTFQAPNGAVGALYYSWEIPSLFKGLRLSKIYGREGSITFESNGLFIIVRGRKKRLIFPGLADISGYKDMFADFLDSLQTGKTPRFTLTMAKRDLEIIEQIYASVKSQKKEIK